MRQASIFRQITACVLATALVGAAPAALADNDMPRRGMMGPGMMNGGGPYGPGYGQGHGYGPGMQGAGPCGGYGPGMMGPGYGYGPGYGMGPGMMQGYGPGMMGPGYGMGPGMMMGPGYGPMMGGYGWGSSNMGRLTEKQVERLRQIQQDEWKNNAKLMQQMQERQRELYRMQLADQPDYDAIEKKSRQIGQLQQQMTQHRIEMQKRMQEALDQD